MVKGTCAETVVRYLSANAQKRLAEKRGCSRAVPPVHRIGRNVHEKPTTWKSGRQSCTTSSGRYPCCWAPRPEAQSTFSCVQSTALARAVVPERGRAHA